MQKIKFISAIIVMMLLQSCNMVAQNVNPSPRYVFFYVMEDKQALHNLVNSTVKDFSKMAFVDRDGNFKADLKRKEEPSMATVAKDYLKPYHILSLVPCDINGNLDPSYSAVPVAFSAAALERMEFELKVYGKAYGPISVSPGTTWVSNICYDVHTGEMPRYNPMLPFQTLGTYYVREQ